jgi:hypothetical protein
MSVAAATDWINQQQARAILEISQASFEGLIRDGLLTVYSPPRGRPRYSRAEVEAMRDRSIRRAKAPEMSA